AGRSSTARRLRPISRWISMVRPLCLPADASRRVRSEVARGSMPYSAVTQPRACPLSQGGSRSSSVAVTSTWVAPNFTKQEPSAYFTTPRSSEMARSSSGCRRLGRMLVSCSAYRQAFRGARRDRQEAKGSGCAARGTNGTKALVSTKVAERTGRARERLGSRRADACIDPRVIDGRRGEAVRLELCGRNGPFCSRLNGAIIVPRRPDRRDAGEPRPAQRALARYFPTDRRELPRY